LPKLSERNLFIGGLFFFAFWLYVALPFLYTVPRYSHDEAANNCSTEESKNHGFWEKTSCEPTAYFTLWLVAFTGVLAVSTIGLWFVTARGVRSQASDTRILQRAYISIEPGGIGASDDETRCHPNIIIRNAGNLPARHVKWVIEWVTDQDNRRTNLPVDETAAGGDTTLPPKAEMTQGGKEIPVGPGQNEIRQQRGLYLYVWGTVFYEDGFGENRFTRFCHRYNCRNLERLVENRRIGKFIDKEYARFNRVGNDAN
jgi:hypothetical protein